MASSGAGNAREAIPLFLLKTKSAPADAYEELFSAPQDGHTFEPAFVPVLQHRFLDEGMRQVRGILNERKINRTTGAAYGGMIFTSQRAVEGFAKLVEEGRETEGWPHLQDVPVYSVGPATTRALKAVSQDPSLKVFGEHTGNGAVLSQFVLEHYGEWYKDRPVKPPLLFLVGEQRRDVIPKTLMDDGLPSDRRILVDEIVVYGTGVMESFKSDFAEALEATAYRSRRWVVVFSPTGCDAMLKGLGLVDEKTGKAKRQQGERTTHIATIGPTTRDYLKRTFDFEPDVCAENPSPEGIRNGIVELMQNLKL